MDNEHLGQELTDQDRVLLVFGYLGPLAILSLIASRREFVKWHAKQGLVTSAIFGVGYLLLRFLYFVAENYLWTVLAELYWLAASAAILGGLLALLLCIVRGLEGERFKLPVVGELADRL
ncbi:MAG: hypothetical protein OEV00_03060 [Acidobacteriota bacterium]|nr:hypothetical protein [Acidobacteriota bacterium]MDH3784288.1 hypothetical protein [Acidobacteriota bacterium]